MTMETPGLFEPLKTLSKQELSRRDLLRCGGLLLGAGAGTALLTACGAPSPNMAPAPKVAANPATVAAPQAPDQAVVTPVGAPGKSIMVTASERGGSIPLEVDHLAVFAGMVPLTYLNSGSGSQELFLFPVQDVSSLLNLKRAGQPASEPDFIKSLAGRTGGLRTGEGVTIDAELRPGLYEIASFVTSQNPDGG